MLTPNDPAAAVATLSQVHTKPRPGQAPLHDVSLTVRRGEIFTLLGTGGAAPSGAATALALFAGFARASAGQVTLGGRLMDATPPHRRWIGMVSRAPTLFPHLDVEGHARFAPGVTSAQADALLHRLELSAFARRKPATLPPEIQFRVALARALASSPQLLLLESPVVTLPPTASTSIKIMLRALVAETGLAILHATDDAHSSYGFSDRVGVIQSGALRQVGTPQELYDRPASLAVAQAMGPVNRLAGTVVDCEDDIARVRLAGGIIVEGHTAEELHAGEACVIALRPERIAVAAVQADEMGFGALPARLLETVFAGDHTKMRFSIDTRTEHGPELIVSRPSSATAMRSNVVCLAWQPHHAHAFRTEQA